MNDKTNVPELLPCPFCGAEADYRHIKSAHSPYEDDFHSVHCSNDDCVGYVMGATSFLCIASAAKSWNTRTPQWQPIETAPKDGTQIRLCNANHPSAMSDVSWYWEDYLWKCFAFNLEWPEDDSDGMSPTHWKPRDSLPTQGDGS